MSDAATQDQSVTQPQNMRSWPLEILGLVAIVGFFVGIAWAWHTQVGALITAEQFDRIHPGQTLDEVEQIFGRLGVPVPDTAAPSSGTQYTWDNSTDSRATCVFADGKLISKTAKNLP